MNQEQCQKMCDALNEAGIMPDGSLLTPETDSLIATDLHHLDDDETCPASCYWRMVNHAREMESQRDGAFALRMDRGDTPCDACGGRGWNEVDTGDGRSDANICKEMCDLCEGHGVTTQDEERQYVHGNPGCAIVFNRRNADMEAPPRKTPNQEQG